MGCSFRGFRGLQLGPASKVATVDKLSVAIALLLAAVFLHERLTPREGIGALLIISGAVLLALK